MTSSEKPFQFCMKSQLILIARGLSINNQKLVDILFQPLTRKHEIRGDAFSKSLSSKNGCTGVYLFSYFCSKTLIVVNR